MKTTLVVLAAGMGSRYGGLKQMDPLGPNGEAILEFSVYDAIQAGFDKIVFIIKKEMEKDFKELIGDKIAKKIEVEYVFQGIDSILPEGFKIPEGRTKPWGTGHALLCCKDAIKEPFAIINADDFYGRESYKILHDYLTNEENKDYCLIGYILENTLTDHGSVTRGVCQSENGCLTEVKECAKIEKHDCGVQYYENDQWMDVDARSLVSMNMWGFFPDYLEKIKIKFDEFLTESVPENPMKSEFLIPVVTDALIKEGNVNVKLLSSNEKWFGVTYQEDKPGVKAGIKALKDQGLYPEDLWK